MTHYYKNIEEFVYFGLVSNNTSGSGEDGSTPLFYVRLAGAPAAAAPVLSGVPTLLTHDDYPAGSYEISVAATVANGFVAGAVYMIYSTLLVDSQNPTGFVGSFDLGPVLADVIQISGDLAAADNLEAMYDGTGYLDETAPASRSQLGNISSSSSGIAHVAEGQVLTTTGTPTNDYTVTNEKNGVYHIVPPIGGEVDFYYEFNVGENGVANVVDWAGYVQANNDQCEVWFYNWVTLDWDRVETVTGRNGTEDGSISFIPDVSHTGTGENVGDVRLRFTSGTLGAVIVNIATDRITCSFAVIQKTLGFMNGSVWIDTINGEAGTAHAIGTISKPVNNLSDAKAIADANNLKRFQLLPGSSGLLGDPFVNYFFEGTGSTINLGGQDITGARFTDMTIAGSGAGSGVAVFRTVFLNNVTIESSATMLVCPFGGTFTMGAGPNYRIMGGSVVAEEANVIFDFTTNVGQVSNLHMTNWSGDLEIQNMGQGGTDRMFISGNGELTINANCVGGFVEYYGDIVINDNSGGAVTLLGGQISQLPTTVELEARTLPSADYFDPAADPVANVVLVDTTSENTDMRGTDNAVINADLNARTVPSADYFKPATDVVANVALVNVTTLNTDMRGTDNAATSAELASVDSKVDAILAGTVELVNDDLPALIAALNNISVNDIMTTQMAEGYAAKGAAPSLAQAIMLIQQTVGDFSIVGSSLTVRKVDGATPAATFTLNNPVNPTDITRTS